MSRGGLDWRDARALAREFLVMSQAEFSARFKGSAVKRAKRRGLARNAAVVLGNMGLDSDVPVLVAALTDEEPLVRAHAAWALGRLEAMPAEDALRARLVVELDEAARRELLSALGALSGGR